MAKSRESLDAFGRFIMENLRDRGISFFDALAAQSWKAPAVQKLQRDLAALGEDERAVARRSVVAAVDTAVHDFLFALQDSSESEAGVRVIFDGHDVARISDGLQGELFGPNGWQARFSNFGEAPNQG
jgi:hypothetical protein